MKIAIIGAGISGMSCAHLLKDKHEVTLLEQNDYLGGHTATKDVTINGQTFAVDTGFIVFNDRTYPLFNRLLARLGVKAKPTQMSFSVSNPNLGWQYNGHNLNTLFAQRRQLFNPRFYYLIKEIIRFNRLAKAAVDIEESVSLSDFLLEHRFGSLFQENYLLPMGAAIWSASLADFSQFPMRFFARFFVNHGLLDIKNRPQWYVIEGGSKQYIAPLLKGLEGRIHTQATVRRIQRDVNGVSIDYGESSQWQGDAVIFACHSDQALAILGDDASAEEHRVLSALQYQQNKVVLHTDSRSLPNNPRARAAWNYLLPVGEGRRERLASVTYDMNLLQGLPANAPQFCVSLNPEHEIDPSKVIQSFDYMHPKFSLAASRAQQQRHLINGLQRSWFCGAYWHNGFHEDGVRSANEVCADFGVGL